MPAVSMISGSWWSRITPPAITTPLPGSRASTSLSTNSGSQVQSSLTMITASPRASATPRFIAREKPAFSSSRIARTFSRPSHALDATEPGEPLSTTITSWSTVWRSRVASRFRNRSAPLTVGTITVAGLTSRRVCSVGTSAAEDSRERLEQDPEVAAEREVLHVVELHCEALGEAQRSASEDLHRPSDARLHSEPESMLRPVATNQVDLLRPRANDAHVPLQHVHELRKLVQAEPPQDPADAGDARITTELEHRLRKVVELDELLEHPVGAVSHRPELVHAEWEPPKSGPGLHEEERSAAIQLDRERDDRKQRCGQNQQQRRRRHVEDALDEHRGPGYVAGVVFQDGKVGHLGKPRHSAASSPIQTTSICSVATMIRSTKRTRAFASPFWPPGGSASSSSTISRCMSSNSSIFR